MIFEMYIKFIYQAHLYWVFILSWSALQIIVTVLFHLMLPQTNGKLVKNIFFTIRAIARARKITRAMGHSRGLFLTKRPENVYLPYCLPNQAGKVLLRQKFLNFLLSKTAQEFCLIVI